MPQLIVDSATSRRLRQQISQTETCDEDGTILGVFIPQYDHTLYEGVDSPLSEEELRQRAQETVWHTTAEVLARLKEIP